MVDRVKQLFVALFDGNQSTMAEALNVSQPGISAILHGHHKPGRRVLDALSSHPRVNAVWLHTGIGEPLVQPSAQSPMDHVLPVANRPLPGPLAEHRDKLLGMSVPVAASLARPGCYLLALSDEAPILRDPKQGFISGDLLLVEPVARSRIKPSHWEDQLVVASVGSGEQRQYFLGMVESRVDSKSGEQVLRLNTFQQHVSSRTQRDLILRITSLGGIPTLVGKSMLVRGGKKRGKQASTEQGPTKTGVYPITLTDIIGRVLQLIRRYPKVSDAH